VEQTASTKPNSEHSEHVTPCLSHRAELTEDYVMAGRGTPKAEFNVVISASGRADVNIGNGSLSPRLVHAVSVSQPVQLSEPVQSWTVIRDHLDFTNIGRVLSPIIGGLSSCPPAPEFVAGTSGDDVNEIVRVRHEAQNWLTNMLLFPGASESPAVRQFLCCDANIVPPQLEGVNWVRFSLSSGMDENPPSRVETKSKAPETEIYNGVDGDELDMAYMFGYEEDFDGRDHEDLDYYYDNPDHFSATERYQPTVDPITHDDLMEFQNNAEDVEMIEDVGSLAQSLGASHLGRSLQLQAEIANTIQSLDGPLDKEAQQGLNIEGAASPIVCNGDFKGGIGNAVLNAASQSAISGLSDSFYQKKPISAPRLDSFKMIKVIGKGSFGKVFLVREIKTDDMFALKVLRKDNIIKRNQVEHTRTERNVLGNVNHPFIVGLRMAFQSKDKLYFVLDYCAGGELFFHLSKVGKFPEQRAAFYAAEIVLALSYIHAMDIIYRDLKPENVLLDAKGHVRLTDFGLSKEGISSSSSGATSFCGTPEYLAPEILNREGHGRAVDWWSLGALLYEMLTGLPPFYCRDREKLFEKIRKGYLEYPKTLSDRAQALLKGLLTKDSRKRLGSDEKDAESIQKHVFFHEIEWEKLTKGEIFPPWDPQIHGNTDTSQFDAEFTKMPIQSPGTNQHVFGTTPQEDLFKGFTFTGQRFYAPK